MINQVDRFIYKSMKKGKFKTECWKHFWPFGQALMLASTKAHRTTTTTLLPNQKVPPLGLGRSQPHLSLQ